jgi:hypothetical protein
MAPAVIALIIVCACLGAGCGRFDASEEPGSTEQNGYWERMQQLYEKAKSSGEQVPDDVREWVKEDVKKIGDWEYKLVTRKIDPSRSRAALEQELNTFGRERWECFWIESTPRNMTFFFKRPSISYLRRALPLKDALKLLPQGEGGE